MALLLSPSRIRQAYSARVGLILLVSLAAASALFIPISRETIQNYDEGSYYIAAGHIRQNGVLNKYGWAITSQLLIPTVLAYGIPSWLTVPKNAGRLSVFIFMRRFSSSSFFI